MMFIHLFMCKSRLPALISGILSDFGSGTVILSGMLTLSNGQSYVTDILELNATYILSLREESGVYVYPS